VSNCVFGANQAVGAASYEPSGSGDANGGALFHGSGIMTIDGTLFSSNRTTGGPGIFRLVDGSDAGAGLGGAVYHQSGV
jgi:hypothetical protein